MVRDVLGNKEYLKKYIAEVQNRINKFEIKLSSKEVREDRVFSVKRKIYDLKFQIFIAKYSMGEPVESLIEDYKFIVGEMKNFWNNNLYEDMLWMLSLEILLETDKKNIERLSKLVEKENMNDSVIDFLLCASDIGYNKITNVYFKENPYAKTREIIELAQTDKKEASKRLQTYMEKEWIKGHNDDGWKNVGFWSFETAAIAKILKLDDTSLINNNHYPYDLAHYKNSMKFKPISLIDYNNEQEIDEPEIIAGIDNNPVLEKIIPPIWHSFVNELIHDYETMDDSGFYEKYKRTIELDQIWFLFQKYKEENEQKNLLGTLIVFAMVEKGYILQLDYKDDLEDYYSSMKNYWNHTSTKLVQFMLDNDQDYYALVPMDVNVSDVFEVTVKEG